MSSFSDQESSETGNNPSGNNINLHSIETTMSLLEVECLKSYLEKSKHYLEFGSGYSTLLASHFNGIQIVTLETDQEYMKFLQGQMSSQEIKLYNIEFIHLDIGPTKEWGWPSSTLRAALYPNYIVSAMSNLKLKNFNPDLILIDGRFRVASFLWCLIMFPKTNILFDDYLERDYYHVVEKVLRPKKSVGRIAIFRSPRKISRKKTLKALDLILEHSYEPS